MSEMYSLGKRVKGELEGENREGRKRGGGVDKEEVGGRGGCMLIGAKWAADEVKGFVMEPGP